MSNFADHYGLTDHMELGTSVTEVTQNTDQTWSVTTRDQAGNLRRRAFRNVVVATGQHWKPQLPMPEIPGAGSFTGESLHSFDYYEPSKFADKNVLILGIGNSACDIAVELSRIAKKTTIAMRRGAHVVPKQMMGIPIDEIAASRWWSVMPFRAQRTFIEFLLKIIRGSITSYGIPEPDHRLFSAPVTISDELLSRVNHGAVHIKPMLDHFDASTVHFADGTSEEFDTVIYCTGYSLTFPFIPNDTVFAENGQVNLFQRVIPPKHRGLFFAGLIRPVGSITRLVELQAEWLADLLQGKALLPSHAEMAAEIDTHLRGARARYGEGAMDSIQIDFPIYLRAMKDERAAAIRRADRLADALHPHRHWWPSDDEVPMGVPEPVAPN